MAKSDATGTKGADASEELLKLLRTINEKLDLGTVLNGREGVAVSGARQNWYPDGFYRWYEETLPSQSCAIRYLKDSEILHLDHEKNRVCERLRHEDDGRPEDLRRFQWRYKYESPFKDWKHEVQLLAPRLCMTEGDFWVIPPDGRISLSLTPESLHLQRGEIAKAESQRLIKLIDYSKELVEYSGEFFIADLDPWNDRLMLHDLHNLNSRHHRPPPLECRLRSDRVPDRSSLYDAEVGDRIFQPLAASEDFRGHELAPWRRIMFIWLQPRINVI
ncbi:hypothetical protein L207DRAFT_609215 [Hyaloscypha variabilis F]|uniref:Uncharacterized protein n=1 Tax=Hyaloscypha variabilis (strain UAMH 11265 / GT02V1 / F) TaxID=1149755 RepID=A0A2J6R288_HYAVF|nr:hypothetical protein L207DRAFT_609215 [Hyaloscypha variabilis F]